MNVKTTKFINQIFDSNLYSSDAVKVASIEALTELLLKELESHIGVASSRAASVVNRLALEAERICCLSRRIQSSGEIRSWQVTLARRRLHKYTSYYQLGSKQGRIELHSNLSAMIYQHVALPQSHLTFRARYNIIEDFLQEFYAESLKVFRRENPVETNYTPRTQLEIAEYMAFTEYYAKRRIKLPNRRSHPLIVLRAQTFARRQPSETPLDIEQAVEFAKSEEAQEQRRSSAVQQVRSRLVSETPDLHEAVLRDRIISELLNYLESRGQSDCADYLILKLQDLDAADIDELLSLTPKERDYLQQRFKYHVEKFARSSHWKLVHQWLEADLDQNLGMSSEQWKAFLAQLDAQQQQLLWLKQAHKSDVEIASTLKTTPEKVQKRWIALLSLAWKIRNLDAKLRAA